ncbi:MAG: hypothetical protein U0235_31210 [Polyangiaceae bacterium]
MTSVREAPLADRDFQARYFDAFLAALEEVGMPRGTSQRMAFWPSVAIDVTPDVIFEQTPGPVAEASAPRGRDHGRPAPMTIRLADLPRCFQGITPAIVATCSKSGEPNVTYASHVTFVSEGKVALSRQFFNKDGPERGREPARHGAALRPSPSRRLRSSSSVSITPRRAAPCSTPWRCASRSTSRRTPGMRGVFLLAADVYDVVSARKIERLRGRSGASINEPAGMRGELRALQVLSSRLNQARSLDDLLSSLGSTVTTPDSPTRWCSCPIGPVREALHRGQHGLRQIQRQLRGGGGRRPHWRRGSADLPLHGHQSRAPLRAPCATR